MADLYRPEAGAPVSAEDAEHRGFATSFRGFDPAEVRAYLRRVASTMRTLQDEQRRLETRAREAERRAEHPTLDDATLAAALGDEMARILRSAQEAAAEIRGKAESHVAAIAQQARDEGARLTAEAASILQVRRAAADAEAEQIIRSATEEADRLRAEARAETETIAADAAARAEATVDEAREQRAAVLSDLRRRRRVANTQIEQLRAGRDRLLAAYAVVGRTLGEVSDELQRADAEARAAADDVGRRLTAATDPEKVDALALPAEDPLEFLSLPVVPVDPDPAEMTAEVITAVTEAQGPAESTARTDEPGKAAAPSPSTPVAPSGGAPAGRPHRGKGRGGRPPQTPTTPGPAPAAKATPSQKPSPTPAVKREPARTAVPAPKSAPPAATTVPVASRLSAPSVAAPPPAPAPSEAAQPADAEPAAPERKSDEKERRDTAATDDLFARLRAEREVSVAAAEATLRADDEPSAPRAGAVEKPDGEAASRPDRRLFVVRAEALDPLEVQLSRRIKRALQDEQNMALDRLRSTRAAADVETALGAQAEHLSRYIAIVQPALTDAAAAGAAAAGANPLTVAVAVDAVAVDLATEIVVPLRRRLDERMHEAAAVGDNRATVADRVGAAYRELKAQRVTRLASDWLAVAWAYGAYPSTGTGALVWTVEPAKPCCTDCDDNALAGPVAAGGEFPTGHERPPAHPGCRCVLVPATT